MRFFVWALGLFLTHNSFGIAILDADARRLKAGLNATVFPPAPFADFDAQSSWAGPPPGTEIRSGTASQKSVVTPEHFAAQMTCEVSGRDTVQTSSIFDIKFHL